MIVCKADFFMHDVKGILPKDAIHLHYSTMEIETPEYLLVVGQTP